MCRRVCMCKGIPWTFIYLFALVNLWCVCVCVCEDVHKHIHYRTLTYTHTRTHTLSRDWVHLMCVRMYFTPYTDVVLDNRYMRLHVGGPCSNVFPYIWVLLVSGIQIYSKFVNIFLWNPFLWFEAMSNHRP